MTSSQASLTWDSFATQLAYIAQVPPGDVAKDRLLVADLGLDSLAITELTVALMEDFGVDEIAADLDGLEWEALTAGGFFERYLDASAA